MTINNIMEFTDRLQELLAYYNLNASTFADKIAVGRSSISHLLSGRNKPSLEFVMSVLKEFPEVTLDWLINGEGDFPASTNVLHPAPAPAKAPAMDRPQPVQSTHNEKSTTAVPNLFDVQNINEQPMPKYAKKDTVIVKIILLYEDGTFSSYQPNLP